jgi:thiosulfate/3-mercaptopyruvate sulfurtransferase
MRAVFVEFVVPIFRPEGEPMSDPMISTEELAAAMGAGGVKVLDASWYLDGTDGRALYREAHIPGAVYFDIDEIKDKSNPLPHMLPTPEFFAESVGAMGIGESDAIVVYDQQGLFSAARAWWSFRVMGADRVKVLDGGLPRWRSERRPMESGAIRSSKAEFHAAPRPELVRSYVQVLANIEDEMFQLVDARSAGRFAATLPEPRAGVRGGHVPGSFSLPYVEMLTEDGRLRPAEELRGVFAGAGLDLGGDFATLCGTGVTASIIALALARLGRWDVPVYDGSWAEWGRREDAPIAVGM